MTIFPVMTMGLRSCEIRMNGPATAARKMVPLDVVCDVLRAEASWYYRNVNDPNLTDRGAYHASLAHAYERAVLVLNLSLGAGIRLHSIPAERWKELVG